MVYDICIMKIGRSFGSHKSTTRDDGDNLHTRFKFFLSNIKEKI
ncbi:hypothetical protein HanIR_Chr12g0610351 [Helianthus annuus]|nr:hypothetical protein HanIR_Chr12g0610351 [Helianthus annuus]